MEDPRTRWGRVGRIAASLGLLVIVLLGALLIWGPWRSKPSAHQSGSSALELSGVTATVSPLTGGCGTKFVFTAKVAVRAGSGQLTYQWIKPDGGTTDPTTGTPESGRRIYEANFEYTLRGPGRLSGDAVLIVSKPVQLRSAPVHIDYVC